MRKMSLWAGIISSSFGSLVIAFKCQCCRTASWTRWVPNWDIAMGFASDGSRLLTRILSMDHRFAKSWLNTLRTTFLLEKMMKASWQLRIASGTRSRYFKILLKSSISLVRTRYLTTSGQRGTSASSMFMARMSTVDKQCHVNGHTREVSLERNVFNYDRADTE